MKIPANLYSTRKLKLENSSLTKKLKFIHIRALVVTDLKLQRNNWKLAMMLQFVQAVH
uniref:Uncharacterized protein n=1 Tax=Meloidogyne enterolobii TaxID=390850 RepID=A0A6V7TZT0_MELEN|nr:unnamed protein product [Meloidogyne enterolobii]